MNETNHVVRIAALWLVISAIVEFLLATVVPIPGPKFSTEGVGEHNTTALLFFVGAPIFVFVVVMMLYEVVVFRDTADTVSIENPPHGNPRALFIWSAISLTTVLFLAGWGTFTLADITDAAGPNPLTVQVIAQQWHFTYRYPSYGGVESLTLAVPVNRAIKFEITSLDVVHDFWIYDEDVKEDAVPGVTTYANMLTHQTGQHNIVCDELCGIWHGFMRGPLYVMTTKDFTQWVSVQKTKIAPAVPYLPPVNGTYYPDPAAYPPAPQNSAQ